MRIYFDEMQGITQGPGFFRSNAPPWRTRTKRTPGSFAQTVEGLRVMASFRARGAELHTSTVVTLRNVPVLLEIYEMLVGIGVQQVVYNALQVHGGADRHFDRLVPTYGRIREAFDRLLAGAHDGGVRASLVDVPACVTEILDWVLPVDHS